MKTSCFIFCLLILLICNKSKAQNCSGVTLKKDKSTGIITSSGLLTSKEFYNLLIQKKIKPSDSSFIPEYSFYIIAASRVIFADSSLKKHPVMELKLMNDSVMNLIDVTLVNNPMGDGFSTIGFNASITAAELRVLKANPAKQVYSAGLSVTFSDKACKKQKDIASCLLQE